MARQEIVPFQDDLDGREEDVRTVRFELEGSSYEIDLGPEESDQGEQPRWHAGQVGRWWAFVAAARKEFNARVREWAAATGHDVRPRGRVPETVVDATARPATSSVHSPHQNAADLRQYAAVLDGGLTSTATAADCTMSATSATSHSSADPITELHSTDTPTT